MSPSIMGINLNGVSLIATSLAINQMVKDGIKDYKKSFNATMSDGDQEINNLQISMLLKKTINTYLYASITPSQTAITQTGTKLFRGIDLYQQIKELRASFSSYIIDNKTHRARAAIENAWQKTSSTIAMPESPFLLSDYTLSSLINIGLLHSVIGFVTTLMAEACSATIATRALRQPNPTLNQNMLLVSMSIALNRWLDEQVNTFVNIHPLYDKNSTTWYDRMSSLGSSLFYISNELMPPTWLTKTEYPSLAVVAVLAGTAYLYQQPLTENALFTQLTDLIEDDNYQAAYQLAQNNHKAISALSQHKKNHITTILSQKEKRIKPDIDSPSINALIDLWLLLQR